MMPVTEWKGTQVGPEDAFLQQSRFLACTKQQLPVIQTRRWGAPLVFEKLWRDTGCQTVVSELLRGRRFAFPVERALFLTVLHRLLDPGSDRAAERWRVDYVLLLAPLDANTMALTRKRDFLISRF
jgi:hypothetical protein